MGSFKARLTSATKNLKPEDIVALQDEISHLSREDRKNLMDGRAPKQSAVLVLIYLKNGQWHIPLIQRSIYTGKHSGQISLPGGKPEPTDLDLLDTAIRECQEEIGVRVSRKSILCQLKEVYVPPSNFLITPYLALVETELSFEKDPREVAEVIEVPLKKIAPSTRTLTNLEVEPNTFLRTQAYRINEKIIWGATAIVLSELELVLQLAGQK